MTTNGNGLPLYKRRELASRLRTAGGDARARAACLRLDAIYEDIEADALFAKAEELLGGEALFAKADELEAPEREARDAATHA